MQGPSKSGSVQSELNVTPMIDVVLVLLIIFMVVTPKNDHQVPVVVPQEAPADAPPPAPDHEPLVMGVDAAGALTVNGTAVETLDALRLALVKALETRSDKVVFLEAHPDAPYEKAVQAMDAARKAGAKHVGFLDQPAAP